MFYIYLTFDLEAEKKNRTKNKSMKYGTEHSTENLNNSWDELREEKAVLIHQQRLQYAVLEGAMSIPLQVQVSN
jgi:hypothetical protein